MKKPHSFQSESGMITLDFIFAFVLVMGFTQILFAMSLTLTVAEVTQYVTFASARSYVGSHIDPNTQKEVAQQKWNQLVNSQTLRPLYNGNWFELSSEPMIGHISRDFIREYYTEPDFDYFHGTATLFTAKMLDFHIPFWGSTTDEGDDRGAGFKTTLGSYLGREVSVQECTSFAAQRYQAIQNLGSYSGGGNNYIPMEDNGC